MFAILFQIKMASDSEDDFLSADEGSDFNEDDDSESCNKNKIVSKSAEESSLPDLNINKVSTHTLQESSEKNKIEDNHTLEDEIVEPNIEMCLDRRILEDSSKDIKKITDIIHEDKTTNNEDILDNKNQTNDKILEDFEQLSLEVPQDCNIEEPKLSMSTSKAESASSEDLILKETEKNSECSKIAKSETSDLVCCKESEIDSHKTDDNIPSGQIENKKLEETTIKKPIRESKIGLKKPRERLGAKKLGSKVRTKPLESISSESIKKENSESESKDEDRITKSIPEKSFNEAKLESNALSESEQERWNQAQKVS